MKPAPLEVSVLGRLYRLKGEGNAEELGSIKEKLEKKIGQISASAGPIGIDKICLLAAADFCSELLKQERVFHGLKKEFLADTETAIKILESTGTRPASA